VSRLLELLLVDPQGNAWPGSPPGRAGSQPPKAPAPAATPAQAKLVSRLKGHYQWWGGLLTSHNPLWCKD
jgi:hypothetical protein